MAAEDKESFLSRWSRRKLEANENPPVAPLPAEQPGAAAQSPAMPTMEPDPPKPVQERSAEYREFFDPQVDEKLRQTALKGLFSDPHFNMMDGLDTYIDDYSIADPIPAAMLRQLNQAKGLFLFDDENKAADAGETDTNLAPVAAADAAALPDAPAEGGAAQNAEATTGLAAAAPEQGGKRNT